MENVCRLCLSKSPKKDIHQLNTGLENYCNSFIQILQFCLNIEVDEETKITNKICTKCFCNVQNYYKFKTLALKTDAYWRGKATKVLVKNEALEDEDDSEVPIFQDAVGYNNIKSEPSTKEVQDYDKYVKDDPSKDDEQFYYEYWMNKNLAEDESGNSCDEDLISKPQLTRGNESDKDQLSTETDEVNEEDVKDDDDDPMYEPSKPGVKRVPKSKPKCKVCNKEVKNLQLHVVSVHEPHNMKHLCEHCGRRFSTGAIREKHIRKMHTEKDKYLCQYCSKTFLQNSKLRKHLRIHTKECPYTCTDCGRSFSYKESLKLHREAKHSDNNIFPCTLCPKVFSNKKSVYCHVRLTHNNKNTFQCGYNCGVTFTRMDNCKSHEKRKHGATVSLHNGQDVDES